MGNVEFGRNRLKDDGLLFEKGQLSEWTGFGLGAIRRHWLFSTFVVLLFAGAATLFHFGHYPKYVATVKVLAMPAEGSPGTVAKEGTGSQSMLSASAAKVVLSRDALASIATRLNLADEWQKTRPLAGYWKDSVLSALGRPPPAPSPSEKIDRVVVRLQERLSVKTEDGQIEVRVEWPNPELAKSIVELAKEQLLAAREQAELSPLVERRKTLEAQVLAAQAVVDTDLQALEQETNKKRKGAKASTIKGMQAQGQWGAMPDVRLFQLRTQILAKRRAISELEDVRRRRMADLKAQLSEQRASLGPDNPLLAETQEKLLSLERAAPELDALRADETTLLSEFVSRGGKDTDLSMEPGPLWPVEFSDDPRLQYAKTRVELSLQRLQELMRESSAAEVSLAAARAAFPARYAVLEPTYLPGKNLAPQTWMVSLAALLAAFAVAFAGALLMDLASGRIHEPWQVKRWVGVQVIGEVPRLQKAERVEGARA